MKFSLIVCTYQRPQALMQLLNSVEVQTNYPDQIIIVDGSVNTKTKELDLETKFKNLNYYSVEPEHRGLTKQRNFGLTKLDDTIEVVCYLDDDTILDKDYFKELINTYNLCPDALGVGGYINNEIKWDKVAENIPKKGFRIDGYERKEGSRFKLRKKFGLVTQNPPGIMPSFSHGRSVGYLPPSGKIYPVEFFMGGVSSYKTEVFSESDHLGIEDGLQFSRYFEGYGLYEDVDFCLRLSKYGQLYVNTKACLGHYHEASGRPNQFKYGKMVIRNGWYVWRIKYPNPKLIARIKWNVTAFLLTCVRSMNIITSKEKKQALTEVLGRISGWFSLIVNPPKAQR
ncbi:MAG: glycosyltransferase family 2 protein [Flavobacteriaceae bacterium]|nr:glycosyltransferase family 2 protein [Flavobacteriaceae bacterium]